MMRRGTICAIATTIVTFGVTPIANAEPDQSWGGVFLSGAPIKDSKFLVWVDGHARLRNGAADLDVSIVRPGVGWRVSPTVDLYVGIASVTQHRDTGDVEERRLWQQAVYQIVDFAGGKLTGRTRLEQRFRDTGDDTGWRLRQFVRYGRPIDGTPLGIVASNEVFVALNQTDWGQKAGFDQNRLFLGISWQVQPMIRIEGGYMNQHIDLTNAVTRDNLAVNLFASF